MKKILAICISTALLFTTASALDLVGTNTDYLDDEIVVFGACDTAFTQTERTQLYNLADFLYAKSSLIENKFPGTVGLTNNFAAKIYTSLEQSCESNIFTNYKEFQRGFSSYIAQLIGSQNLKTFKADIEAEQAILQLQQHIIKILTSGYDIGKAYDIISTTDFDLDLSISDLGLDLNTNAHIETEGKYNLAEQEFDVNIALDLLLEGKQEDFYSQNAGVLNLGLDINLIQKDDMFIAVDALTFDVTTDELGPAEQMQVAMAQNMLDTTLTEIKGKYINISENIEQYATDLYTDSLMNPQLMFSEFTDTAMFDFYKSNNIRYGKLNTNICKTLEKIGLDAESCEEEINTMNLTSQGKGYLLLQKEGIEYKLGLTDKHIIEKTPTNLDYSEIISRNSNNITSMYIPLDEENIENKVTYNNDTLDINYNNTDVNFGLHGTINDQTKSFQLNIIFDDDIVLDADIVYNKVGSTQTTSMEAVITQNDQKIGSFTLANEEIINYLQFVNIQKPTNTISIEELEVLVSDMGL